MRDILVHIDDGARCRQRLDLAVDLARRFGARLTGLFARIDPFPPDDGAHRASESLVAACGEARRGFDAATAGLVTRWFQLGYGEPGHVLAETVFCARTADLVVVGQGEPKSTLVPEDLAEHVILQSGRPVLVVPRAGEVSRVGERIAVVWNASREAARAVADALPLLTRARAVTVLAVDGPAEPRAGILDYLAAWGIAATIERLSGEQIGKLDLLLARLTGLGSDLVVMGAQGNGPLSLRRGAAIHFVLAQISVPVLMSH